MKMHNVKDKEKILKQQEKSSYLQGSSHKTVSLSWFLNRNFSGQKGLAHNIQSDEKQGTITEMMLHSKSYLLESKDR